MKATVKALDRATGKVLAKLANVPLPAHPAEWKLARLVRPYFVQRAGLTNAQAACALYRFDD